jgi:hypothetical protein
MMVGVLFEAGCVAVAIIAAGVAYSGRPKRESHQHAFGLIGTTYTPPSRMATKVKFAKLDERDERVLHGCTSFVWKCLDPECDATKTVVVLGKQEVPLQ